MTNELVLFESGERIVLEKDTNDIGSEKIYVRFDGETLFLKRPKTTWGQSFFPEEFIEEITTKNNKILLNRPIDWFYQYLMTNDKGELWYYGDCNGQAKDKHKKILLTAKQIIKWIKTKDK